MHEPNCVSRAEVVPALNEYGLCIVTDVNSRRDFVESCAEIGTIFAHRDSENNGVTRIVPKTDVEHRAGFSGFSAQTLELHTDRSTELDPPNVLAMLYARNSDAGGELLCVDGQRLQEALRVYYPHVYRWAREPRRFVYDDGSSSYEGPIFREESDGTTSVRFRADDNGFYPRSAWPNIELFLKVAHSLSLVIRPKDGDMVVMHNGWWLHGRTKYLGQRVLLRLLLNGTPRLARGFRQRAATACTPIMAGVSSQP